MRSVAVQESVIGVKHPAIATGVKGQAYAVNVKVAVKLTIKIVRCVKGLANATLAKALANAIGAEAPADALGADLFSSSLFI